MRVRVWTVFLGLLAAAVTLAQAPRDGGDDVPTARLGKKIGNLKFANGSGPATALYDLKNKTAVVIVFLSFECPVSNSYAEMLKQTAEEFGKSDVAFLGLTVNPDEDAAAITKHVRDSKLPFSVYRDDRLVAADALAAQMTPEVFVLDGDFVLRYRGRIDDAWAARLKRKTQSATKQDLKQALGELLSGRTISVPATKAIGCAIPRESRAEAKTTYTYHRDVAPILQKNCQTCHRPGEVGPFSLLTYKQAVNWADDIKTYTQARTMPPWKPVAGGPFHNERRLTDREIDILANWADGGTPEGDPKDAPAAVTFPSGWQLGQPDLILTVPEEFTLGGTGHDVFRCFVLPTGLTEDKQVIGIEVRPGNPRVVHHTFQFIDTAGQGRKLEARQREKDKKEPTHEGGEVVDRGPGYSVAMGVGFTPTRGLGGWAPGNMPRFLPEGTCYQLPKNSDLVMQVHYHRNGRVEKDRTQVGLYFAKKQAERLYQGSVIPGRTGDLPLGMFFTIPAGKEDFVLKGDAFASADCTLYTIMPHMHMIGRKIKVTMTPPDGPAKTLVSIDDWDYNWQETYIFRTPMRVKAGTRFEVEARYDNSVNNPNNPSSPPRTVTYGEQTTNEMCFIFLGGVADEPGGRALPIRPKTGQKK
jgi:peroxiredoxin